MQLADVQARFEVARVFAEQVAKVGSLFVAGLDLGAQVGQIERATVELPHLLLVVGAHLREFAFELAEALLSGIFSTAICSRTVDNSAMLCSSCCWTEAATCSKVLELVSCARTDQAGAASTNRAKRE